MRTDLTHASLRRTLPRLLLVTLFAAAAAFAPDAAWTPVEEHWYTLEIDGARAGSMSVIVQSDGGRYRTETGIEMSVGRGPVATSIEIRSTFVETHGGEPLRLTTVQDMGIQAVEVAWEFNEDGVVQTARQGGRETRREIPLADRDWLTPMAARRYWLRRRAEGATEITYRTLDPQAGLQPVEMTQTYMGDESFEIEGAPVPVTVWTATTSLVPLEAVEKYTADGTLVYQEIPAPIGTTVMRLSTKSAAQGRVEQAPEILVKSFVRPDRPIPRAGRATTARLRLLVNEGRMPELPAAGAQRVAMRLDFRAAELDIDIDDNVAAPEPEREDRAFVESSAMVDADDPLIQKLAERAVEDVPHDAMARAEALRASVHRLISEKGLDTAFATASETARTRAGDCSEHAVLLCALLRAQGIPARVAVGLVYADSFLDNDAIFGWHMWTQALIDDAWVDFDATLPRRYHAAHVLTATSSLGDTGLSAELVSTLTLMGNLEIEVVEVGYGDGTE